MRQTLVLLHISSHFPVVGKARSSHLDLLPAECGRCVRQRERYNILVLLVSSQSPIPLLKIGVTSEGLWNMLQDAGEEHLGIAQGLLGDV